MLTRVLPLLQQQSTAIPLTGLPVQGITLTTLLSVKPPGLEIFKKSLLNVPYDRNNEGLNILSYCLY